MYLMRVEFAYSQDDFELLILLLPPSKSLDYRSVQTIPGFCGAGDQTQALGILGKYSTNTPQPLNGLVRQKFNL